MNQPSNISLVVSNSRRRFLKHAIGASTVFAVPNILTRPLFGAPSANGTVNVGLIGCGNIGGYHRSNLGQIKDVRIIAVADAYRSRRNQFAAELNAQYGETSLVKAHADFREILARPANADFNAAQAIQTLTVTQATPVITWAPTPILAGTLLSDTQLNASSGGVAGGFVYDPPIGTALPVGTHTLSVQFTPADTVKYSTPALKTVSLLVVPVESTVFWNVGSGTWDTTTPNWLGQTSGSATIFTQGNHVIFNKTDGGMIAIASGMSPASITVSGSGNYTFSGNPIATGSLTKSGGGGLSLEVTPANFSSIAVNGGTLYLHAADHYLGNGDPINMGTGSVTVESGATLMGERAYMAGTLTMNGGRWWEDNGFGGSWTGYVYLASDSFFGQNGWCCNQTIFGEISGPGGFTFSTQYGGVLGLFGTNSYTGPTIVNSGTLACQGPASLGHTSALSIASGGKVLPSYTGDQVVASLTLGGVPMPPGTYGSSNSTAANKNDTYFATSGNVYWQDYTGKGTVTVAAGSAYDTWATTHGLTGTAGSSTDPAFDADPNKDGVANGLVWLIGGTTGNPLANSNSILPVPTDDGGKLVLTFKCLKPSARGTANLTVQFSKDLGAGDAWHGVSVPDSDQADDGSGVGFVVTPIKGSDYNNVTATIAAPALGGKLFGRLMATEN